MTRPTLIGAEEELPETDVAADAKDSTTTTSCPKGGWKYSAKTHYLYDLTGKRSTNTVGGGSCAA